MNKIVLMGYMGSGKSTIGKILSKSIDYGNIDLDEIIELKENKSIKNIFSEQGELYFRKLEHQYLIELLKNNDKCILSLGGGTPCYANNLDLFNNEDCVTIYIKRSVDYLHKKLSIKKHKRPLIANLKKKELKEYIAKHLFERSFYYNQANIILNTENKSKTEIVEDIKKLLF